MLRGFWKEGPGRALVETPEQRSTAARVLPVFRCLADITALTAMASRTASTTGRHIPDRADVVELPKGR